MLVQENSSLITEEKYLPPLRCQLISHEHCIWLNGNANNSNTIQIHVIGSQQSHEKAPGVHETKIKQMKKYYLRASFELSLN